MPAEPTRIVLRGDDADCAIVAISMYTGCDYADVVREVLKHDVTGGATGLTNAVIRKTMAGLGHPVRWTKRVDFEDHYGILCVYDKDGAHAVVLKYGQVIEVRATWCGIWTVEDYLKVEDYAVEGIFLGKD